MTYYETEYYDVDISAECPSCEKEYDLPAKVNSLTGVAYWTCPKCNEDNETSGY
jgi:rubredoxin